MLHPFKQAFNLDKKVVSEACGRALDDIKTHVRNLRKPILEDRKTLTFLKNHVQQRNDFGTEMIRKHNTNVGT